MSETEKKDMPMRALGEALGISAAMVSKLKKQGMPLSSIEDARQWRADNLSKANPSAKLPKITLEQTDIDSIDLNDKRFSNEESLKRALLSEYKAGEMVQAAIKTGNSTFIRQSIETHTVASKTRAQAKEAYLEIEKAEGNLLTKETVMGRDNLLFQYINGLIQALPDGVLARINIAETSVVKDALLETVNEVRGKIAKRVKEVAID